VLIGGEKDAVAVAALIREIREPADSQQVRGVEERESVFPGESLPPLDLDRYRFECGVARCGSTSPGRGPGVPRSTILHTRRTASVTLCPPNPNEFDSATSTSRFTEWFGAESRSQAGSGVNWLIVGGMTPWCSTRVQTANSSAPAAPSRCPVIDFVDPKISFFACGPNTVFTAAVSAPSPCGVDVPWALM